MPTESKHIKYKTKRKTISIFFSISKGNQFGLYTSRHIIKMCQNRIFLKFIKEKQKWKYGVNAEKSTRLFLVVFYNIHRTKQRETTQTVWWLSIYISISIFISLSVPTSSFFCHLFFLVLPRLTKHSQRIGILAMVFFVVCLMKILIIMVVGYRQNNNEKRKT